jgi:Tol biopolymer transport system component
LKRIDIGNDLTETLCDVDEGRGGTWSSQDVIMFAGSGGLFRVPASGGTSELVTKLDPGRGQTAHLRPQFLPDGHPFIFLVRTVNDRTGETYIGDLETGEMKAIANGRGPAAVAAGLLLFSRGSTLAAQEFDDARGLLTGDARTIGGIEAIRSDLWMLPVTGDKKPVPLGQTPANESQGTVSPDGRWIAYVSDQSGSDEVYVRAFPPSEGRWQISSEGARRPRWRDDGRELLFLSPDGQVMSAQVVLAVTPTYGVPRGPTTLL